MEIFPSAAAVAPAEGSVSYFTIWAAALGVLPDAVPTVPPTYTAGPAAGAEKLSGSVTTPLILNEKLSGVLPRVRDLPLTVVVRSLPGLRTTATRVNRPAACSLPFM